MRIRLLPLCLLAGPLLAGPTARLAAQVTVSPTGVNLASQGATTAFLTFGGLTDDLVPAEAFWCRTLVDAAPDVGRRCDPATLYGSLPARFDRSRPSGSGGFTDIMSVPASVARRAYQSAAAGRGASFFYVRRFRSRSGGPDVFASVICRLTAGGAAVPFSLTDVRLAFDVEAPVLALDPGAEPPAWHADIVYTGTGRLRGRWEVVRPGEDLPDEQDLLPEAALPLDQRGGQRRFTELARFSVFLPPTGRARLPGPDPHRLPTDVEGTYLVLLRVEADDDRDSQSDLAAVGAGSGPVSGGAVAGFPLPPLLYVVGSGITAPPTAPAGRVLLLEPIEGGTLPAGPAAGFSWAAVAHVARYLLEIERLDGTPILDALLPAIPPGYRPPPLLAERAAGAPLRWRVRARDASGREIARSAWRTFTLPADPAH